MRFGIIADIHANLQALEAVMTSLSMEKTDRLFCLGDIVGYGANPRECLEIVRRERITTVAGNHDWGAAGCCDVASFNAFAKDALLWTREQLTDEEIRYLASLELTRSSGEFVIVHGSLEEPGRFIYIMDEKTAVNCFRLMESPVCFVGHSHVAGVFTLDNQKIIYSRDRTVKIQKGLKYIVNAGSVGQPRDGNPQAAYCIFDTHDKTVMVKRVSYDIAEAQDRIMKAGLPPLLASRLQTGQ